MNFFRPYSCIKQHDTKDCGVACLVTVARQYGLKISFSQIRQTCGTDLDGTSALGIINGAKSIGFIARGAKINNYEDIFGEIPLPAIAHVITDEGLEHYVVIHKVTKNKIIVADPDKGIVKYNPNEFFNIWDKVLILIKPSNEFKKGNYTKGNLKRFFYLMITQKKIITNVVISSIVISTLGIIGSLYFKLFIDYILPNNLEKTLVFTSIAMLALSIFNIIIDFFRNILLSYMSQNIDIHLILGYYNHVINLPMNFFSSRKTGDIISRFSDAENIRESLSSATLTLLIDSIMAFIGGVILYRTSPYMFFLTLIPVSLYIIFGFLFKKTLEDINIDVMKNNSNTMSYLVESIEGIETIKSFNAEDIVSEKTDRIYTKFLKSLFKYDYISNYQDSIITLVQVIFEIIILCIGGKLVLMGDISIGTLISFNTLLIYFMDPIESIVTLQPEIQSALVAIDRLNEIFDLNTENTSDGNKNITYLTDIDEIVIKNLNFRYGSRNLVLKDINMAINSKQRVAFVGQSGSGKSTLSKLIMGFYDIEQGEILLNNNNIKNINKDNLREKVAYISQEPFLFSGTIIENLQLANKNCKYEEIIDICKKVHIHDFIENLPLGYNTVLEEKGNNLSVGQKQRISIARALLKKPSILIMDEVTSNLDSITESIIEKTITNYTSDITTIIIAHRLSTIKKCDKIYVFNDGEIVEEGSHNELMSIEGYYSKLWNSQIS